jgi:type II secretory pathway pseudopilin PulG
MKSAKCPQCGFVGWADAESCKKCGAPVVAPPADQNIFSPPPQHAADSHVVVATDNHVAYNHVADNADEHQTYYYPPQTNPFPEELKNGWAIGALVSGLLNFLLFSILVLPPIAGIVISAVALKKIKRQPFEYGGHSMAVAGLALNIISAFALIPVLIIAAIAIPNLMAARRAANEGSAINALRNIHSAEMTYQATEGNGEFGDLAQLQRQNLINAQLASGARSGYKFDVDPTLKDFEGHPAFAVVAVPIDYPATGKRSFFIDETGVIRGEDNHGLEASRSAPPLRSDGDYSDARSRSRRPANNSDE